MAPFSISSGREYSIGEWLIPPALGMKIIPIGAILAMLWASWPAPLGISLHCRARRPSPFEHVKRLGTDLALLLGVPRLAGRITEWEVDEKEPRHANLFDDVARRADDDCGDGVGFEVSCDQGHTLVTHRAMRNEHCNVYVVGL